MVPEQTDVLPILRQCRTFAALDDAALQDFVAIAQVRVVRAGEVLARPGESPPGMFIVARGRVRVFSMVTPGKEHTLIWVSPVESFLEVPVFGGFPCPAYAQAETDVKLVLLPAEALRTLLVRDPALSLKLLASVSRWVRHLLGMVEDLTSRDAMSRVARYLCTASLGQSLIHLDVPKKDLANHLNLTGETLSRSLRRLVEAGVLEPQQSAHDRTLRIGDRERLEALAAGEGLES